VRTVIYENSVIKRTPAVQLYIYAATGNSPKVSRKARSELEHPSPPDYTIRHEDFRNS
jgi:hypothetical protein